MMEQVRAVDTEQPRNVGLDLQQQIERLKREHRELKARLSELNSRLHLSIDEEIERKTIYNIVSKPIARYEFVLGKYLGMVMSLSLMVAAFALAISLQLALLDVEFSTAVVKAMIKRGAEVNAHNGAGYTARMIAAAGDLHDVAAVLLEAGADPTMKSEDGRTALTIAREREHRGVLELLEKPRA